MKKIIKKTLAGLLVISISITSLGLETYADITDTLSKSKEVIEQDKVCDLESDIICELAEDRTENSNTYLLNNGLKQMVYYTEPIRYKNKKGKLIDYNPELKESRKEDYLYENTAGDSKQYIPQTLNSITPIVMTNKDYKFSFTPVALGEELSEAIADTMLVEDIYEEEKEMQVLASFRAEQNEITYEYQSLQNGVKENIILDKIPENNIFAFTLKMSGMIAREDDYGKGITFIDEETEYIVGGIEAPYMNDATRKAYSEDIEYVLKQMKSGEENIYLLYMYVDREYLEAEDRVYPVTIDPTATWTGSSELADVYIVNGDYADTNFYSSYATTIAVGKGTNGVHRSLIRPTELTGIIEGKYVESAKLTLYEYGTNAADVKVQARHLSESFSLGSVTWNTKPAFTSMVYAKPSTTGTGGSALVFDMTTWARELARGEIKNRGLTIKANSESEGSYCRFYGGRSGTTSKRPKIVVNYYDAPTQATSISLAKQYITTEEALSISWAGIESRALDYINYRVYKYDDSAGALGNIYIDYSDATKIGTTASGTKNITVAKNWPQGHYVIYIKGVDKSGISGTSRGIHFYIDRTLPVISSLTSTPSTSSTAYSSTLPTLSWKVADTYYSSIQASINGGAYASIGTAASGSKVLSGLTSGSANTIKFRAVDKAGNVSATKTIIYYYDNVAPVLGEVNVLPSTDEDNPSTAKPQIEWGSIVESRIKEVQYSINDSAYKSLGNTASGNAVLPESAFGASGAYDIKVRAVDTAGNVSSVYTTTYYYESPDESIINNYKPVNLVATEKLNGATIIEFNNAAGEIPEGVTYQIYRGEQPLFAPSGDNLICEGLDKFVYKMSGEASKTYYYKIRAVMTDEYGNITAYSDYSDEISSTTVSSDELAIRAGTKEIYDYMDYATPLGNGHIELSKGNLLYQENDGVLSNSLTGINITRTYNSMSAINGAFGASQTSALDMSLSVADDASSIIYRAGDGSVYTCTLTEAGVYESDESTNFTIEETDYVWDSYDEEKPVTAAYVVTGDEGIKTYFDYIGRVCLITDDNSSWTYFNRNKLNGCIDEIVTDKGEKATFTWEKADNGTWVITGITLSNGKTKSYSYDSNGYLIIVTEKSMTASETEHISASEKDITHSFTYNEAGRLCSITDALGNVYGIEYTDNKAVTVTYPDNHRYSVSYGDNNSSIIRTSPDGLVLGTQDYVFDETGKVTQYIDENSNVTTYTYVGNDISGQSAIVKYNVLDGNVITSKEKETKENIIYDERGNILSYTNEQDYEVTYTYSSEDVVYKDSPLTEVVKDTQGNIVSSVSYEYDDKGNVLKVTDNVENTSESYDYNEDGSINKIESTVYNDTNSADGVSSYEENVEYNEDGSVDSASSQAGTINSSVDNTYNSYGYVVSETDEKSNKTEYWYDGYGRIIRKTTTSAQGKITTVTSEYNDNGSLIKSVDEVGRITEYTYDECNRVIKETYTAGSEVRIHTTTYGYESVNIHNGTGTDTSYNNAYVVTVYNTQGEIDSKTYTDSQGRTIRELKDGIYCDYTYDSQGNVYTSYMGGTEEDNLTGGKLEVYTYDENGNITATLTNPVYENGTFAVGEATVVTTSEYDKNGNLIKETDPNGNSIQYEYDPQGRIIKVILNDKAEEGITNIYDYDVQNLDENGKLVSVSDKVTDALGRVSLTTSNVSGQVLKVEDIADTGNLSVTYEYDASGNKTKETYADGSYISYSYDELNVLKRREEYSASSTLMKATEYEYDAEYNLICAKDINGENEACHYTYYTYDEFRRTSEYAEINATDGSVSEEDKQAHTIKYTYDIYDRLSRVDYPDDGSSVKGITISYNNHNWVTGVNAVIDENGTEIIRKVRTYVFHNDGKIKEIRDYKNFLVEEESYILRSYEYDALDRVTLMYYTDSSSLDTVYERHAYTYDKNSNIISETDYMAEAALDRTRVHIYDSLNRLTSTVETDNATGNVSETFYEYDKVGNRTKVVEADKTTLYTYNELNQVIRADISGSVTGYKTYEYDGRGNQVTEYDSITDTYTLSEYDISNCLTRTREVKEAVVLSEQINVYDGDGKRISKTENGVTTNYYYEGGMLLYTTDEADNRTSLNIAGTESNVIAGVRYDDGESIYFYGKDIKGSTSCITDATGNVVVSYLYDDWGQTTVTGDTTFYNQICYTGGVYDELTKLYYLNARYYNPETGAFMSQDSVRGSADDYGTWNLYAYCAGNPVCYVDPSGHIAIAIAVVGGITIGEALVGAIVAVGGAYVITEGVSYARDKVDSYKYNSATNSETTQEKKTEKKDNGKTSKKNKKKTNNKNDSGKYKKASLKERIRVRKVNIEEIHPNPLDEFSNPRIGASEVKVAKYIKEIRKYGKLRNPIEVQKLKSGGYEIVNGHHRWLAAVRSGLKKVTVRIRNYIN